MDADENGLVDDCVIADASTDPFPGTNLFGAEVDCHCPTTDCQLDVTGDAVNDCYTPDGQVCGALSDSSGFAQDCLTNPSSTIVVVAHQFLDDNNNPIDQPWDEIDNDGDNYVECDQFDLSTYRSGGGSFNVVAGLDCDDYDAFVYPTATEYCDGQFNNCEDIMMMQGPTAPTDEVDDDGDGFVECELTNGVAWAIDATNPAGDAVHYRDGTDENAYCDGPCDGTSTCTYVDGTTSCTPNAQSCTPIGGYGDCDDTDAWEFPDAPDLCDLVNTTIVMAHRTTRMQFQMTKQIWTVMVT